MNIKKFLNVIVAMEKINDKFIQISKNVQPDFPTKSKFWIFVGISVFILYNGIEATYIFFDMKTDSYKSHSYILKILTYGMVSTLEIYISVLYLLMTSSINSFYYFLYQELDDVMSRFPVDNNILIAFGKYSLKD